MWVKVILPGVKFGRRAGDHGAWAAGVQYFGYGSVKGADVSGVLTGDFSPKDMVFSATYAHDITDTWRGGASVKYIYSTYDAYTAMAVATDLGVNYYDAESDLSFSAMLYQSRRSDQAVLTVVMSVCPSTCVWA